VCVRVCGGVYGVLWCVWCSPLRGVTSAKMSVAMCFSCLVIGGQELSTLLWCWSELITYRHMPSWTRQWIAFSWNHLFNQWTTLLVLCWLFDLPIEILQNVKRSINKHSHKIKLQIPHRPQQEGVWAVWLWNWMDVSVMGF